MAGRAFAREVTLPDADITAAPPAVAAEAGRLDAALDKVML